MGIDAVIVNRTKKRIINLSGRLHAFPFSSGANLLAWLVHGTHGRSGGGQWAEDDVRVIGDMDLAMDADDYMHYKDASEEVTAWLAYWKDEPGAAPEELALCKWMRAI